MKRFGYVNIKLIVLFLAIILLNLCNSNSVTATELNWNNGSKLVSKTEMGSIMTGRCPYAYQTIVTPNNKINRIACVYDNGKFQIAHYFNTNSFETAIKFSFDLEFHKINNTCSSIIPCIYVEKSDTLISQDYYNNYPQRTLVFYDKFTERLSLSINKVGSIDFNSTNPNYVLSRDSLYIGDIGSFGVSENGSFAAFEMKNNGYFFINIDNKSIKRISNESPLYNYGMNPSVELAVSNNGNFIAITGYNAGFEIIYNTDNCGDQPSYLEIANKTALKNRCLITPTTPGNYVNGFSSGHNIRFKSFDKKLTMELNTYSGVNYQLTLSTLDYTQKKMDYIAMGDSFSSGEGDLSDYFYRDNTNSGVDKCHTSLNAYSYKLLNPSVLDRSKIVNIACSGAVTSDILGNSNYIGQNNRLLSFMNHEIKTLQMDALDDFIPGRISQKEFIKNYQPAVATIGIGGNDVDLVGKLIACLSTQYCAQANTADGKAKTAKEIQNLFYSLTNTYNTIINESPSTKLYAIGYPKIIKTGTCNFTFNSFLDSYEREYANEAIEYINTVIAAAAKYSGIKYIDIANSLDGYKLCDEEPLAVNALRSGEEALSVPTLLGSVNVIGSESFHPTPYGHQLIANKINSEIGDLVTYQYCTNGKIACPDSTIVAPNPSKYWGVTDMNSIKNVKSIGYVIFDGNTFTINTPDGLLLPSTQINISIHSDTINVGNYTVNDTGGLNVIFQKPENLDYGVHTIILSGKTFTGEDIELQQIFQYIKPKAQITPPTTQTTEPPTNPTTSTINESNNTISTTNNPARSASVLSVDSEPAVLSETSTIPEVASTNTNNIIESFEKTDKVNETSVVAIVIAVFSLLIFIRYVFFNSKLSNKK